MRATHQAAGRRGALRHDVTSRASICCSRCAAARSLRWRRARATSRARRSPGGTFESVLPPAPSVKTAAVRAVSRSTRTPVTNADFARFVREHPRVAARPRRARVRRRQAICSTGQAPTDAGCWRSTQQPVTQVSWFAASAYCEARGARLPTLVRMGVRGRGQRDRAGRARRIRRGARQILDWYSRSARGALPDVGSDAAPTTTACATCTAWCGSGSRTSARCWSAATTASRVIRIASASAAPARSTHGAEGELRHADAHRDAVEHAGQLHLARSMGFRCATDAGAAP